MLDLSDVTLCCADTRSVSEAMYAVQRCLAVAKFGRAIFLGPDPLRLGITPPKNLEWITIPRLKDIEDYNRLMLRGLNPIIKTSHVLIVQWDGFITHPHLWRTEFLNFDYIGAPWYHGRHPGYVGNGGFSIRSKKLLDALAKIYTDPREPEDHEICVNRRAELERNHGIHFAPLQIAQAFSCEYGPYRPAFGFHGMHNLAFFMDQQTLRERLMQLPAEIVGSKQTRKLIKALIQTGRTTEASALIRQRSEVVGWTWDQCLLMARAKIHLS